MRNLKRALSLALAAAMLISLMVVGASAADYGDQAQVKQTEAVEVLTGLGVVGGDQNGNFNPTATLTRAEFCVMIANALTGGTFDRTLFDGATTPFTDVQGHWGQAYIAYCYSNGIIAGTSATTFSPDATLTAAQAAAILLMALGYNQNNEFALNGQFELNGFMLDADIPERPVYAELDVKKFKRVYDNILGNFFRYNQPGRTFYCRVEELSGRVQIILGDNGRGIPEAIRSTLFDPFVVGEKARTSSGSGLGLSIARRITEGHGGTLYLQVPP